MDDSDIRNGSVSVYRGSKNGLLLDHPIWMLRGKMVRGSVQIHDHSRDVSIKKGGHPFTEPVQRPGCGITVENEFGFREAYHFTHFCRDSYSPVRYRDQERVSTHLVYGFGTPEDERSGIPSLRDDHELYGSFPQNKGSIVLC